MYAYNKSLTFFRPAAFSTGRSRVTLQASRRLFPSGFRSFSAEAGPLTQTEVTDRVINVLKQFHKIDGTINVAPTSHFMKDLGLDSLDAVEVIMSLEDEFCIEIPEAEAEKIVSCQDAISYVLNHPQAK